MAFVRLSRFAGVAALGLAASVLCTIAHATTPAELLAGYAACHLAYPPALLPSASWQRLMSSLPRHFGADASLDPATVKRLDAWLQANAGSDKKSRHDTASPPQDRITRSSWFVHEHDEVAPATWKLPTVKSASKCAACHRSAEQGVFDEHDIRVPR
jgi:hypothetical protein